MGKRLFWIFVIMVVVTTTIAVTYFQSESFARLAKARMQAFVAKDLGLDLNFDYLRIGVLPPSLSMVNVELKVLNRNNPLGLATDTLFKAERVGFSFRMIQAFSRGIAVNKVFLSDGSIRLMVPKGKNSSSEKLSDLVHRPIRIDAGDGFTIDIRQLEVRDTALDISWRDGSGLHQVQAGKIGYLAVTPSTGGTSIVANLDELSYRGPTQAEKLKVVKTNLEIDRNGLEVVSLDVQRRAAVLHATGTLSGSIDAPAQMKSALKVIVRTPLAELADFEKSLASLNGNLNANVTIEGKINEPKLTGGLELEDLRYGLWEIDRIEGQGAFAGGRLTVTSFAAQKGAGRVSLKEKFEATLPFRDESIELPLQLTKFRFEDFAGDLRHSVNNLKAEIEGTALLKAHFGSAGGKVKFASATAALDLRLSELELNNQAYGKKRPYKRIFQVQPFTAQGDLSFRNEELRVNTLKLGFGSGSLAVKGTVSDPRGFDLQAQGDQVDFGKEIGSIGGIPVEGAGGLKVHVKGALDQVMIDFDLKMKNARYVRFDLGDVDGRVTYDDRKSRIVLSDLKGQKLSAAYEADGEVSVGDTESLSINATFADSDPNHLFAIFKEQLKDISWIPHGMGGLVSGKVQVGGLYTDALYTLRIDGDLQAKNLNYQGEMVHSAAIKAHLSDGVLKASVTEAKKYDTPFAGEIEYRLRTDEMKYWLEANKGKLRSLDFLSSSGFPIDGLFDFRSEGRGKWETLESKTTIGVRNAFVRTRAMPPLNISFVTDAGQSEASANLGGNLEATAKVSSNPRGESSATLRASGANLDFLLCGVSRKNCTDPNVGLFLRGETKLSWKGRDWQALSGAGTLQDLQLSRTGFLLRNEAPVPITAAAGTVETPSFQLKGEQTRLAVKLKGRVDGKSLDNRVDGSASLRLLEFLTPVIEEARGQMAIGASLGGNLENASFRGQILLQDGFLRLTGLDAPVESLNGKVRLDESKISLDDITAQLGGGSVQATGGIDLFLNRAPRFAIDLFLANNRLKFFPVNFVEVSDGKLSFTGDKPPYLFGGLVRMRRVVMRNDFDVGGGQKSTQHVRYLPESARGSSSFYEIRVRAIADGGVVVQNNLLDAEFRGEVTLLNNFEFPQIVARAELVRGKLLFRNTTFTLDHASIRAPTPELFNPQFSIGGTANVDVYRINIFASGTVDKPKITLNSYPAMPQEDIVSLLAFGYRGEEARRVDPNNTSAITYSEVTSILLDQLKLSQNLQSKGLRVMVMPDLSETEEQIARPDAATQAAPKVYLQTQILRNLDASFGATVGAAQTRRMDARLDYRIGRKATMSAVYEQIPAGLDAVRSEDAYRNSYGADLKFRWGFR